MRAPISAPGADWGGTIDFIRQCIVINENICDDRVPVTLLHEIVHGILSAGTPAHIMGWE
ncbi:MAG: hypothetical protein LBU70_06215 [Chitinispirillales bacterium]|nr:hypothetical protein [Chitinispirillales bacterium]